MRKRMQSQGIRMVSQAKLLGVDFSGGKKVRRVV